MAHSNNIVAHILRAGILIAVVLAFGGGFAYIIQHGHETVHYEIFLPAPKQITSLKFIFLSALDLSAVGLIQLGLLILVLMQIIRVLLSGCYFLSIKDFLFSIFSFVMSAVLTASFLI